MAFFVITIAILVERFFDWSHVRQWYWYEAYQLAWLKRCQGQSSWLALSLVIIPLLLAVFLVSCLVKGWLYGVVTLVLHTGILLYCLGPQNFWVDAFVCIHAFTQGDQITAIERLHALFGIRQADTSSTFTQWLNQMWLEANQRVFAVLCWYVLLGPLGCVLYRALTLSAQTQAKEGMAIPGYQQSALLLISLLNWLPMRLLSLTFTANAKCRAVFQVWRERARSGIEANESQLIECGQQALDSQTNDQYETFGLLGKQIISIFDKSLVIFLALMLVISLIIM